MLIEHLAPLGVGVEIVGIVRERADIHALLLGIVQDMAGVFIVLKHAVYLDMRDAAVLALCLAFRPARDLHALDANARYLIHHLLIGPSIEE